MNVIKQPCVEQIFFLFFRHLPLNATDMAIFTCYVYVVVVIMVLLSDTLPIITVIAQLSLSRLSRYTRQGIPRE